MNLKEIYESKRLSISFEVFPPKPQIPLSTVYDAIGELKDFDPAFISVTYGAGGSQKGRTVEIASTIKAKYGMESMAHLTCVGSSKEQIDEILDEFEKNEVKNILALLGDPPVNDPNFSYENNYFRYARDLIEYIKSKKDFCVAAAAYPEGHKSCTRMSKDWEYLKGKVDAGADILITQLFFDNRIFYNFLENMERMNVRCPIIPGIMPIFNGNQIKRIMNLCGGSIPAELVLMIDKFSDSPEDLKKAGIEYAIKQIINLKENGVKGIHLEPMNKAELAKEILKNI